MWVGEVGGGGETAMTHCPCTAPCQALALSLVLARPVDFVGQALASFLHMTCSRAWNMLASVSEPHTTRLEGHTLAKQL
eukprot:1156662-Pelagomonas_calceolata.AAC.21